jgi:hypothetical protein
MTSIHPRKWLRRTGDVFLRRKPDPTHFRLTVVSEGTEYFVTGSPKGMVIGPRSPGKDDHITVGGDENDFQVHRKINGREDWRLTLEALEAELDSFAANHVKQIDRSSITGKGTYLVSLRRTQILFSTFQGLASIPLALLWRLVVTWKVTKVHGVTEAQIMIDPRKIEHLRQSTTVPLRVVAPLLRRLAPIVMPRMLKAIARFLVISPEGVSNQANDVAFIVSDQYVGIVWEDKTNHLKYLPANDMFQMYERIEASLPFGKIGNLSLGNHTSFSVRSWTT